ncbi:MAG: hypothetical protein ACXWU2_05620 [Allosphingosinicella sp.]
MRRDALDSLDKEALIDLVLKIARTNALRNLGIVPPKAVEAPINGILQRISDLDQDKIAIIARTLGQAGVFNEVVRDQTAAMAIGERYRQIARQFDSIRDDAKAMVDQLADSRIDLVERFRNAWMKVARGDIADRFDAIKVTYIDVTNSTKDQVNRETIILDAYRDFRGALKHAEVLALEVLRTAQGKLDAAKAELAKASQAVAAFSGSEPAERARHLPRRASAPHPGRGKALSDRQGPLGQPDHRLQHVRSDHGAAAADHQRQGARLLAGRDVLLHQRLGPYRPQGVFHRDVWSARVDAVARGHEGGHVEEPGGSRGDRRSGRRSRRSGRVRADHRADAVKKLVDSVVTFQERSLEIVNEMRTLSTQNSAEIRDALEDGKRRIARLVAQGEALPIDG